MKFVLPTSSLGPTHVVNAEGMGMTILSRRALLRMVLAAPVIAAMPTPEVFSQFLGQRRLVPPLRGRLSAWSDSYKVLHP